MIRGRFISIIIRYCLILIIGLKIETIYKIFRPLTVYPVYYLLKEFGDASLLGKDSILYNGLFLDIVPACIAGSAYYLLIMLNLTTPMMLIKRFKNLFFILSIFLVINIARIIFLVLFFSLEFRYYDFIHRFIWYFGSTILVIAIWFLGTWIFQIREIPMYDDLRHFWRK